MSNLVLTKLKLIELFKLCKKYNIPNYKNLKKKELINKINYNLMGRLTINDLYKICIKYNINKFKGYAKDKLIYKIKASLFNNKNYNAISSYYFDKIYNISNLKTINKKLNKKSIIVHKKTNESFGITCEYIICKLYKLDNNLQNRIDNMYIKKLTETLDKFKNEFKKKYNLSCNEFLGYQNNAIDFNCYDNRKKIKNISLSIKSNINSNALLCPQFIGQCTLKSFIQKINNMDVFKSIKLKNIQDVKKFIIRKINLLFDIYYKYLFCCNYLLWVKKDTNNNIEYDIIEKPIKLNLKKNLFSFTKTLDMWNESNTLKYDDLSVGIFQIHTNRDCIKFRFNFKNLMSLID